MELYPIEGARYIYEAIDYNIWINLCAVYSALLRICCWDVWASRNPNYSSSSILRFWVIFCGLSLTIISGILLIPIKSSILSWDFFFNDRLTGNSCIDNDCFRWFRLVITVINMRFLDMIFCTLTYRYETIFSAKLHCDAEIAFCQASIYMQTNVVQNLSVSVRMASNLIISELLWQTNFYK